MKKMLFYLALVAGLGIAGSLEAKPTPQDGVDEPDPNDAISVQLFGINLDDDIYLDNANDNALYSNPADYEANPGGTPEQDPFIGQQVQPGLHYLPTNGNNSAMTWALEHLQVEVFVWGPNDDQNLDFDTGKVAFKFSGYDRYNDGFAGNGDETFHIKEIFFDDPSYDGIPIGQTTTPFLSNMQFHDPTSTPDNVDRGKNAYQLSSAHNNATSGDHWDGGSSYFPHWDPFGEGINRDFDADFAVLAGQNFIDEQGKIEGDQSIGLVFDYDNDGDGINAFAQKVNAVRFGFHAGGLPNGESIKVWVEMPFLLGDPLPPTNAVPEPTTLVLLSTGLLGMVGYRRWSRKAS